MTNFISKDNDDDYDDDDVDDDDDDADDDDDQDSNSVFCKYTFGERSVKECHHSVSLIRFVTCCEKQFFSLWR